MDLLWRSIENHWPQLVLPAGVFLITVIAGWLARRALFHWLERWSAKSKHSIDDILVEVLRGPFLLACIILGLSLATQSSEIPQRIVGFINQALLVLWIVTLTVAAAQLARTLIRRYGAGAASAIGVTTLAQSLTSGVIILIGMMIILDALHVSITPILTALGVGGLAVALALQDTLSNLFSGFYMSLSGQVRSGDYVRLNSGEEGFVTDVNWRSTTLRALANNLILIPNAKLAQAIITNYSLPEKRMSLLVPVSVSYECDPDEVERILVEEAKAGATEIHGLLAEPEPFVRFIPGFGPSSLDFTLICQVSEFVDQYLAQHELRKRIFRRFRKEQIEIPFPIQTLYLKNQQHHGSFQASSRDGAARGD